MLLDSWFDLARGFQNFEFRRSLLMDDPFSIYARFYENLLILIPWYTHALKMMGDFKDFKLVVFLNSNGERQVAF